MAHCKASRPKSTCEKHRDSHERAQISAEALILLIAGILVATATAGVLFQTAGVLQSQSAETNDEIEAQVSPDLSVVTVIGEVNQSATDPAVETVRVIVTASDAGSGPDVGSAQIRLVEQGDSSVLSYSRTGAVKGETFAVNSLRDEDGSVPILTQPSDRFAMVIETEPLKPNEQITIGILLENGGTETVRVSVPPVLDGDSSVELQ